MKRHSSCWRATWTSRWAANSAIHPGDYAFGPRNIPHSFATGDAGCRVLFILTPGGFENLLMEVSEPARTRTVPPPSDKKPDIARLQKIVARYGNEILV